MTLRTPGRLRFPRAVAPAVALVLGSTSLGACAAGQRAQTSNQFSVVDGVAADVGTIGLRDLGVSAPSAAGGYPKASTATLAMAIVNNGREPDALISVTTPAAAQVVITAPTGTTTVAVSSGTASGAPSASPSGPPTGALIDLPPSQLVRVGSTPGSGNLALTNLANPLIAGQSIPVTFTFRSAGSITVKVPVKLPADRTGGQTVPIAPSGAG